MGNFARVLFGLALLFQSQTWGFAGVIADSITEFSGVQGQDNWSYGFFNNSQSGYNVGGFVEFKSFNAGVWKATDDQTPGSLFNNDFLSINSVGGHPTGIGLGQDQILWAVRRYTSEVAGLIKIDFDLRKENVLEPRGGGITGRIFIDGTPIYEKLIANLDNVGVQSSLFASVNIGSKIDFAIDSLGVLGGSTDDPYSARADGSRFSATISQNLTVPEPSSLLVFGLSGFLLTCRRRSRRDVEQASLLR